MKPIMTVAAVAMISACTNFQSIEQSHSQVPQNEIEITKSSTHDVSAQLKNAYQQYKGTPYKYGGTDQQGFDCSGFINRIYLDAFNLDLPRTTDELARAGKPIRRDQLQAGDIIIFKTSIKQLHAGIYTENGSFIHASTSKGVIRSSLNNPYWHQRYIKARRLL